MARLLAIRYSLFAFHGPFQSSATISALRLRKSQLRPNARNFDFTASATMICGPIQYWEFSIVVGLPAVALAIGLISPSMILGITKRPGGPPRPRAGSPPRRPPTPAAR